MSPKRQKATAEEVEREASGFILHKLGNRLWAGEPVYDERRKQWSVPIHSRSLPADKSLEQVTLNAQGDVVRALSRRAITRAVQRHLPAAPASLPPFAFAPARGGGETEQQPLALPALPDDPQAIAAELLADPDMKKAYRCLKLALTDPQMRPTVLAALEAFAWAAKREEQ
jgi:hypothetical protein